MNKDRIDGLGSRTTGSVKEAIGKVTGDTKLQAKGAAEKAAGAVQNAAGCAKDNARHAGRK